MTLPRVIGIGSYHGDDQAGWLIVDHLRELGYPHHLLRKSAHPSELLDEFSSEGALLICDACEGSGNASRIHRWRWPADSLLNFRSGGTHHMSVAEVLGLADQFAKHRLRAEIWAVTGSHWIPASHPSPAVQRAAREAAARIWRCYRA